MVWGTPRKLNKNEKKMGFGQLPLELKKRSKFSLKCIKQICHFKKNINTWCLVLHLIYFEKPYAVELYT